MDEPSRQVDIRFVVSTLLELCGVAAVVWGCTLIAPFLGFIVGGVGLIALGWATDPPARAPKEVK